MLQGLLLSGSDDNTARVWDTVSGQLVVLQGHRDHVRGLVWHTEVPYLAITGWQPQQSAGFVNLQVLPHVLLGASRICTADCCSEC